ncbi:hypothetical protein SAMN05660462_00686 [Proteiniborus ethanoligenes]|uniref:Uncharacterized protein n=1 Tax=Proteiniborus ethanoligenes TaxID=415015 RepID=A0A1H3M0H0_9FIRM|nr:hypothetical protein [Proteiniborus ethanoligenes]SDY70201.1 hypothetical protein SAMN05660462_00686 [Proteiniborus ethanoligenes]
MSLIELIYPQYKIISIVGMAKNSGKTVALNSIIQEAIENSIILGLTSTGRDGESQDIVTNTDKPPIYVEEGTFIATASETLELGDAKIEILQVTDIDTPLGKIVIGKVKDRGYLQIAGPQTNRGIKKVADIMLELGAQLVLIDGAINRLASASPSVSEGVVLATGAVLSRDINKVMEETLHTVELFSLPEVKDNKVKAIAEELIEQNAVALIDNEYNTIILDIKTALNSGATIGQSIDDNMKYIVFPGSLVKKTVEDIIKTTEKYKQVTFIVKDGTKIFIEPRDWQIFKKKGINIKALESINTILLTLNPYSPEGYYFQQDIFLSRMREYIKDIPVLDLMYGGG